MNLADEFAQIKAEFAKQIALKGEKAKNMNVQKLKEKHSFKKMTSESGLGLRRKLTVKESLTKSNLTGSTESLPSVFFVERGDNWVSSDEFGEMMEVDDKTVFNDNVSRLNNVNIACGDTNIWAGSENSRFQELERDITSLQEKINEMSQSVVNPSSTRRLVTFLEAFKSELPMVDTASVNSYDSGIDRTGPRVSFNNYDRRQSFDSYRAACHESPPRVRPKTCIAQFSAMTKIEDLNQEATRYTKNNYNFPSVLGTGSLLSEMIESYTSALDRTELFAPSSDRTSYDPTIPRSIQSMDMQRTDVNAPVLDGVELCTSKVETSKFKAPLVSGISESCASGPGRPQLHRSRVLMGARTVQNRALHGESVRGKSVRAYSSSDLLGENKDVDMEDRNNGVVTSVLTPRTLQSRAKSYSYMLSSGEASKSGAVESARFGEESSQSNKVYIRKDLKVKKSKDESRVQKFFKRIKKFVKSKDEKAIDEEEMNISKKMTRSFSYSIDKSKNLPKRLKSFHFSSTRLSKETDPD